MAVIVATILVQSTVTSDVRDLKSLAAKYDITSVEDCHSTDAHSIAGHR